MIFSHSGKHLDSLQVAILQGVLKGQKYAQIAVFSWMDYFLQAYEGLDPIDFCY